MSLLTLLRRKGASAAAFVPTDIAGLKLWLKADSLALNDADPVTTWTDSSGLGNDVTQGTAAKRPIYKAAILNGRPVVRFDGVDDWLAAAADFLVSANLTVLGVFKVAADSIIVSDVPGAPDNFQIRAFQGAASVLSAFDGTRNPISNTTPTNISASFSTLSYRKSGDAGTTFRQNGGADLGLSAGAALNGTIQLGQIGIATDQVSVPLSGDLAELLIYDTALSTANHDLAGQYLATRYGFSWTAVS